MQHLISDCEIITLNSKVKNNGLGTRLVNKAIDTAKVNHCKSVWLITTNDNTHAIRFYQKKGFERVGFYKDAMKESRKLKPEIGAVASRVRIIRNCHIRQNNICFSNRNHG